MKPKKKKEKEQKLSIGYLGSQEVKKKKNFPAKKKKERKIITYCELDSSDDDIPLLEIYQKIHDKKNEEEKSLIDDEYELILI